MILRIIGYLVALFGSVLLSELVLSLGQIFLQRNVKRPRFSLYIFIFQNFLKGVAAVLIAFLILMLFRIEFNLFMSLLILLAFSYAEIRTFMKDDYKTSTPVISSLSWLTGLAITTYLMVWVL